MTVVLASGQIVEASTTENADLFWAIRGAGSNFGIVAEWRLQTYAAPEVVTKLAVVMGWNQSTAVAGLEAVEHFIKHDQPAELNFRIGAYASTNAGFEGLYYGGKEAAVAAIKPLLDNTPNHNLTQAQEMTWIEAQVAYSNVEDIDYTFPSPVSRKCPCTHST